MGGGFTRLFDQARRGLGQFCTLADPMLDAVEFDIGVLLGVTGGISPEIFEVTAIARVAAVGHDDAEHRRIAEVYIVSIYIVEFDIYK